MSTSDAVLSGAVLASMLRFISDTGLRGVESSVELLSPALDATDLASASGELRSSASAASGCLVTDDNCVCGNETGRLASLESDTAAISVGFPCGSGKTLMVRFACKIGRLGNGGGLLTLGGKSDVPLTGDCFCDCRLATDNPRAAATADNLPLSPSGVVLASVCLEFGTDNRLGTSGGFNLSPSAAVDVESFEPLGGSGGEFMSSEIETDDSSSVSRERG